MVISALIVQKIKYKQILLTSLTHLTTMGSLNTFSEPLFGAGAYLAVGELALTLTFLPGLLFEILMAILA